jgi:acyl carrier protein
MDELKYTLKQQIITILNLNNIKPDDIDENAPLFGEGLGFDSIDILEFCWFMEKYYGIRINYPSEDMKSVFKSINTLTDYIYKNRTK